VPTCRSEAEACPEGHAAEGGAAALISYVPFVPLPEPPDQLPESTSASFVLLRACQGLYILNLSARLQQQNVMRRLLTGLHDACSPR
jgi:hypothetical protein